MKGEASIRLAFRDLDELNHCLHEQPDGSVGGPLHIVTDDGNLQDCDVLSCARDLEGRSGSSVVVSVVAREMVRLLLLLTPPQRLMWYLGRQLEEIGESPVGWAVRLREGELGYYDPVNDDYETVVRVVGLLEFPGLTELRRRCQSSKKMVEVLLGNVTSIPTGGETP